MSRPHPRSTRKTHLASPHTAPFLSTSLATPVDAAADLCTTKMRRRDLPLSAHGFTSTGSLTPSLGLTNDQDALAAITSSSFPEGAAVCEYLVVFPHVAFARRAQGYSSVPRKPYHLSPRPYSNIPFGMPIHDIESSTNGFSFTRTAIIGATSRLSDDVGIVHVGADLLLQSSGSGGGVAWRESADGERGARTGARTRIADGEPIERVLEYS
ncbi:hypothetical protein MKEN_00198000 [Mycena kentingensis (nom. inval.)]|nr:hypothetical protein MKEN_00198000 [Mycena kentingensis (nom. inval.)]